jgi:aspartate/methionine/tyrosine aminotransferase
MKNYALFLFIIVLFVITIYIFLYTFNKTQRKEEIKKKTIVSSIAEPYFIEETISPLQIELTPDIPGENGGLSYFSDNTNELNIKMVHDMFKNDQNIILPQDTQIVFGSGATMMVIALYYALEKKLQKNISVTTNTTVFYTLHEKLANLLKNVEWVNPTKYETNAHVDLAVIVSPSNPLGIITSPKNVQNPYMLYDLVYDKPQFTGVFKTVNEDLFEEFAKNKNIFIATSFSKCGIPGARCGFLITRDKEIADYCREYVDTTCIKYSTASLTIGRIAFYKYFIYQEWHKKNYEVIKKRRLEFIQNSKKHNIKIFNGKTLVPFMYTDKSVEWWVSNFNVETRKGSDFNDTDNHSRFNLMLTEECWEEFMRRFK